MKVSKKKLMCAMIDAGMNFSKLSNESKVSKMTLSRINKGANTTFETLSKISHALGVNLWDLMEET